MKKEISKIRGNILGHELPLARSYSLQLVFLEERATSKILQFSCAWRWVVLALLSDTQVGRLGF